MPLPNTVFDVYDVPSTGGLSTALPAWARTMRFVPPPFVQFTVIDVVVTAVKFTPDAWRVGSVERVALLLGLFVAAVVRNAVVAPEPLYS